MAENGQSAHAVCVYVDAAWQEASVHGTGNRPAARMESRRRSTLGPAAATFSCRLLEIADRIVDTPCTTRSRLGVPARRLMGRPRREFRRVLVCGRKNRTLHF